MKRRGNASTDAPGQDSFLDIVANLVGILIILVIVVGFRARDAIQKLPAAALEATHNEPPPDVEGSRHAAEAVEQNILDLETKIEREDLEINYRRKERDKTLLLVTALEKNLELRRQQLDESRQAEFDRRRDFAEAQFELEKLREQHRALENDPAPKKVIKHLPTPMAKTVFGREAHFRLQGGRIEFVPWDELTERLKIDAPQKVWKLKDSDKTTETIGPVRGFLMKYTLKRTTQTVQTRVGAAVQQRVELDRFVLLPTSDGGGESLEQALDPRSELRAILSQFEPNRTTVTVWVYPDSFEQFRLLKEGLFKLGYLTAGRPLPEDQPIGGSPHGTRSAAQ